MRALFLFVVLTTASCGGSPKAEQTQVDLAVVPEDMSAASDLAHQDLAQATPDLASDMTEGPPTFSGDVFPIFDDQGCLDCHMTDTWDAAEAKYGPALVTYLTSTMSEECPSLPYVTPGDPANSYLYQKIRGAGSCFIDDPMPDDGSTTGPGLDTKDADRIEAWILEGAPAN